MILRKTDVGKVYAVVLSAICATGSAQALDTKLVLDARPGWMKLHAKALELASRNMVRLDGKKPMLASMPGVNVVWQWDSCLMALYAGYTPGDLNGLGNVDNLYAMQAKNGFMNMAYDYLTWKPKYPGRVNPPLFAWCEWLYAQRTGDLSRLPRAYNVCTRYYNWLKANRRRDNGLYWFEDTGSSGMDNSPRSGYVAYKKLGSDVCFVDLCCQQVLAARSLAKIASTIGMDADVSGWTREADSLTEDINKIMWCEKTGFYHDVFTSKNNKLANKTAAAFWALVSGVADSNKTARLVAHLSNPETFGAHNSVPSLSRDDPNYDPDGKYWLGGVWPPLVYMVCRGLRDRGYAALSREIAARHLDCMLAVMESPDYDGSIWELYSPERPTPGTQYGGKLCRKDFVSWGGLGPIVLLAEDIIGLDINAVERRSVWTISEPGRQGLRDFPFNGGRVTLLADADFATGRLTLNVTTDRPFFLKVAFADGRSLFESDIEPSLQSRTFTIPK